MDNQNNLESQSLKDHPWTTEEIRKHSSNWTLAGDVGLFNLLNEFSHHIISRTHEVENSVDCLVHQTKMTAAKISNVINDFHMLSNLQFVENRVYDEEIKEPVAESKPVAEKSKEEREAEMLPKIVQAIELGLSVLDTAFDRINVNEISDSEDEDISSEGRTILEPKDPYEHRPLPYIIGSEEFMKCDYAGLKDLVDDDASLISGGSSASETEETSSDEGEMLPLDDDDDRFSRKPIDEIPKNISDNISSSDNESDLFGSEKEVNDFSSETSLEFKSKEKNIQRVSAEPLPEKETRKSSVTSLQAKLRLPQVLPVPKVQERQEDDLFKDHSDDESPFQKKAGLFVSDIKFKDEKDDDLFGEDLFENSESKNVKEVKSVVASKTASKKPISILPETRKPTLFDNEDSEDDIFDALMKTKKPTDTKIAKESKPIKPVEKSETSSLFDDTEATGSQDSSKADTLSTPSSAPSTKPSGNAFDFLTAAGNNDLFGDDSDGDNLFSSKKSQGKKFDFDSSEKDDLFNTINSKAPKESKQEKKEAEKFTKKKTLTFFEDSDSSDQERQFPVMQTASKSADNKKESSLFGDDDLEDNIFSKVTKESKSSKFVDKSETSSHFNDTKVIVKESKLGKPVEKPATSSLFDDAGMVKAKESKSLKSPEKSKSSSLFDDTEEESTEVLPSVSKVQQSNLPSLFEDSDNFDLFAPKPPMTQSKPVEYSPPVQVSLLPKDADVDNEISFDTPIDSSNILNVINKNRVKVAAKRRKPTRQGRLAALESSEKEAKADSETVTKSVLDSSVVSGSDSFSNSIAKSSANSETLKHDYKSQEKKKMNIMSQLISEVATSKVVLKKSAEKVEEDEEDEVDIFSEAAKGKSKSSFSFKSPEENGIASMFLDEKKDQDDVNASKSDSLDDDFFTEPAFQNFRSSISHKDSVLDLESDEDDDLFSAIKTTALPKVKTDSPDSNELFDDTDIFADAQKEKYEMFPNQVYDEDDDIFSNASNSMSNKLSSKTNISSIKKVETKQVNAFDDPLTGLLEE